MKSRHFSKSLLNEVFHLLFVYFQIYALNKVMTELEQQQFEAFCKQMQAAGDSWLAGPGPEPGLFQKPSFTHNHQPTSILCLAISTLCLTNSLLFLKPLEMIVQQFSKLALCRCLCSSWLRRSYHSACFCETQVTQQQLPSDQNGATQHRCYSKLMKSKNNTLEITPPSRTTHIVVPAKHLRPIMSSENNRHWSYDHNLILEE